MREPHPDFQRAAALMNEQMTALQREFGHIVTKKRVLANSVVVQNNPEAQAAIRNGICALMEGSLLVYLFAMWEAHTPNDRIEWLTDEERATYRAYQHVRNSVAHGYGGARAERYREEFEAMMPFGGIVWDQESDTIDLSNAVVALRCRDFMSELSKQLIVRLHKNEKPPRTQPAP